MTKLTDLQGDSIRWPEKINSELDEIFTLNESVAANNMLDACKIAYEDIHLEVDVKSLDKIIIEYCNVNSLLYDGTLNLSRHLSDTIPKWARLVRK